MIDCGLEPPGSIGQTSERMIAGSAPALLAPQILLNEMSRDEPCGPRVDNKMNAPSTLRGRFGDRIQVNAVLIVVCFCGVLALSSQSAASFPTYILALAMLLSFTRWNDVLQLGHSWMILAVLGYLVATCAWSDGASWSATLSMAGKGLLVFSFVVAFAECQLRGQLQHWMCRAMAVVGCVAACATIAYNVEHPTSDGRIDGLGQLRNEIVAALVFGVVLLLVFESYLRSRGVLWRGLVALGVLSITTLVYLSDSRNAWFSVACGLSVFALAHVIKDRMRFVASVAAALVILASLVLALMINEETRQVVLPRGLSFRPEIWSATFAATLEAGPWFGAGILTDDDVLLGEQRYLHAHSLYLSLFFQGGLLALGLFALLSGATVRVLLQHYHDSDAKLALGILAIAFPAYVLDGNELLDKIGWTWFLYWMPVAIALGLSWHSPASRHFAVDH
jgi:O-antigen ligase